MRLECPQIHQVERFHLISSSAFNMPENKTVNFLLVLFYLLSTKAINNQLYTDSLFEG